MIHFGGFTCCLGAVALYLLSRRTGRVVKSITRVYHLKDLDELLQAKSKVFPLIIAVSGRVGSETPLKCEQSGILGVFIKETAQNHLLKRNWRFSWVQDTTLLQPITKEVPWYLDDGTGRVNVVGAQGEIRFPLTLGSEVFEKSEPSSSLVRRTLDYLKGLKMLGVKRIERVLPIGTPLTVVGEAVKDGIGDVRIQKPDQGPFYVSPMPLDELISKLGKWSRRFMYASIGLTVLGVILISKPVIEYILERRQQRLLRQRVDDAAAATRAEPVTRGRIPRVVAAAATRAEPVTRGRIPRVVAGAATRAEPVTRGRIPRVVAAAATRAEPVTRGRIPRVVAGAATRAEPVTRGRIPRVVAAAATRAEPVTRGRIPRVVAGAATRAEPVTRGLEMQHENRSDVTSRDDNVPDICVICLDRKCNTAFVQCGHVCCCVTCSLHLPVMICPLCRTPIDQVLKIYRH